MSLIMRTMLRVAASVTQGCSLHRMRLQVPFATAQRIRAKLQAVRSSRDPSSERCRLRPSHLEEAAARG